MKTLYIECGMGAAGDMLMGALSEIAPDLALDALQNLQIPGVEFQPEKAESCGITGTHMRVLVHGHEEGAGGSADAVHTHSAAESAGLQHDHEQMHDHGHEHLHDHDQLHGHDHEHGGHAHEHTHTHAHSHTGHEYEHGGHAHHHAHHSMADIAAIIKGLDIPEAVKQEALQVYQRIAAAESKVHGTTVTEVHFHEVGALDAVADVVGNCLLISAIHPDRIVVSPINTGSGHVHCAHGILPVPAPATAEILKAGVSYSDGTNGELCTPTGAALLTQFADAFGPQPPMQVHQTGIGLGTREFPGKANGIRVFLGDEIDRSLIGLAHSAGGSGAETSGEGISSGKSSGSQSAGPASSGADSASSKAGNDTGRSIVCRHADLAPYGVMTDLSGQITDLAELEDYQRDVVAELSANIDDMTGEELGFAMDRLLEEGALDVYHTPIVMKKSRPAVKFSCICRPEDAGKMTDLILRLTTTIGVRMHYFQRAVLSRTEETEENGVTVKTSTDSRRGIRRRKIGYDDAAAYAREHGISLREARHKLGK
jgi:uncharacterized protein (DUF111 family)